MFNHNNPKPQAKSFTDSRSRTNPLDIPANSYTHVRKVPFEFEHHTPMSNKNSVSDNVLLKPEDEYVEQNENGDFVIHFSTTKPVPIPQSVTNPDDDDAEFFKTDEDDDAEFFKTDEGDDKEFFKATESLLNNPETKNTTESLLNPNLVINLPTNDESSSEEDENKPLIGKNPPLVKNAPGWVATSAAEIKAWGKEAIENVKEHPVASVLGAATAAQPAFNAFLNPSHTNSKDFNWAIWNVMSLETKAMSITEGLASFLVNYPAGKKFIGDALEKLKTTKEMLNGPKEFFDNLFSLIIGTDSGAGAAALTFTAFVWIATSGAAVAIPSGLAGLSFIITSASRYIMFKRAIVIASNLFSHDAHVQRQAIDELKHLKLDEKVILTAESIAAASLENNKLIEGTQYSIRQILQALIDKESKEKLDAKKNNPKIKNKNLNDEDYESLFLRLIEVTNLLDKVEGQSPLFDEKTTKELMADYINISSQLSFALIFGLPAGAIFMQEGFNAVNIISKLAFNHNLDTNDINVWYKRLIGLCSGVGSGTLYAVSAADFPKLFFVDLPAYLRQNPKHIVSAIFLVVINFFASFSMRNVTENIMQADNILGLLNEFKNELPYIVQLGGAFVNIRSKLMEYKMKAKDANHPEIEDVIERFEDPNLIRIKSTTADRCSLAMHGSSFFNRSKAKAPTNTPPLRYNNSVNFAV